MELTHEYLVDNLHYDPETGVFTWKLPGKGRQTEKVLGSDHGTGYLTLRILGVQQYLHRLAWFYVHGKWPDNAIDHINGVRADNRIANIRDVTRTVNNQNLQGAQENSKSGYLGVREHKGRFHANIGVNSKSKFLGSFDTAELASEAYQQAKLELHRVPDGL